MANGCIVEPKQMINGTSPLQCRLCGGMAPLLEETVEIVMCDEHVYRYHKACLKSDPIFPIKSLDKSHVGVVG
jgi:hypothetical protein